MKDDKVFATVMKQYFLEIFITSHLMEILNSCISVHTVQI
jgi:hypothetical protein